jgi:Xaa-Pro dipeptidase
MFKAGGEPPAVMPYVTSGPRSMIGHATWEGRIVQPNEHIFLEVGGCYRRYHTAMMRTVVLGELTDSMYKAQERMKTALRSVHDHFQPGMTVSDADNMIRNIITHNEVGARLITRSGYSIGIAFPPSWDEGYMLSLNQGDATVFREGMTFHVIPWMWAVDGDKTCGISDTIVITKDGCESFFDFEEDFSVMPNDPPGGKKVQISSSQASKSNAKASVGKTGTRKKARSGRKTAARKPVAKKSKGRT